MKLIPPSKKLTNRLYGLDQHGSHWYWNCGWRTLENPNICLPHHIFHRSIAKNIRSWTDVLNPKPRNNNPKYHPRCRPYGDWRPALEQLYDHQLYGEVLLKETDGVHAMVEERDGLIVEVQLSNLTLIKPRTSSSGNYSPRQSKWGDLKEFIPSARKRCKELGVPKPTNDQLRKVATLIKTTTEKLFAE